MSNAEHRTPEQVRLHLIQTHSRSRFGFDQAFKATFGNIENSERFREPVSFFTEH
jgi:hypothetical protein